MYIYKYTHIYGLKFNLEDTVTSTRTDAGKSDMVAMSLRRRCPPVCVALVGSVLLLQYVISVALAPTVAPLHALSIRSSSSGTFRPGGVQKCVQ